MGANYCIDRQYQAGRAAFRTLLPPVNKHGVPHTRNHRARLCAGDGAGPVGMAPAGAAERGHDVTLFEGTSHWRQISIAAKAPQDGRYHPLVPAGAGALERVDLRLGTAADGDSRHSATCAPTWCWRWAATRLSKTNIGGGLVGEQLGRARWVKWRQNVLVYAFSPFASSPVCPWPTLWPTRLAVEIVTDDTRKPGVVGGQCRSRPTTAACKFPKEVIMTGDMMLRVPRRPR